MQLASEEVKDPQAALMMVHPIHKARRRGRSSSAGEEKQDPENKNFYGPRSSAGIPVLTSDHKTYNFAEVWAFVVYRRRSYWIRHWRKKCDLGSGVALDMRDKLDPHILELVKSAPGFVTQAGLTELDMAINQPNRYTRFLLRPWNFVKEFKAALALAFKDDLSGVGPASGLDHIDPMILSEGRGVETDSWVDRVIVDPQQSGIYDMSSVMAKITGDRTRNYEFILKNLVKWGRRTDITVVARRIQSNFQDTYLDTTLLEQLVADRLLECEIRLHKVWRPAKVRRYPVIVNPRGRPSIRVIQPGWQPGPMQ